MRFASDISLFWLLPWLLISFLGAYWFYKNVSWFNDLSRKWQLLIRGLRTGTIFLIGLLLIGLIVESVNYREEKPVLITMIDNSSSMLNYKDSSSIRESIEEFRANLKDRYEDRFELVDMTVGNSVAYNDKLSFTETKTDLSSGFERLFTDYYNRNIGGVVLITDGNFNEGSNPVYSAEKISLTPVFPLLVGDTVKKRDHYVKNVTVNDVAFFRNKFPVEVDIESIRFGKEEVEVKILNEGKVLASKKIRYSGNSVDFQHVSFELEASKIGFQAYTVEISEVSREYNYRNNRKTFYIEVIDSRSKILLLAGAPHPDISAIKQELEKDENLEVISKQLKDWNKDLKKVDMVVVHEPGFNMESSVLKDLVSSKVPVLFCVGPNAGTQAVKELNLGLTIPSGRQTDEMQAVFNEGFSSFEISNDLQRDLELYPPLKTKFGELKATGAEVLAFQRLGNVRKKDPLIFFMKRQGVKYGFIYGEGLWKWRMNEFARTGEQTSFNELITKIGQYLLVKQNTSSLRVDMPKRFTKNEDVIVNASFYNESLEPITTPKILLTLKDEKGKVSKFQFGAYGTSYRLNTGRLDPGKYEWTAIAKHNGKTYTKSGVFIVEDLDLESLSNSSNSNAMRQLAEATGGSMIQLSNAQDLLKLLENRDDITTMSYRDASFDGLIDFKFLFLLLLLFLAGEWFLRRWFGAY
jgi:hypothetical protein